MLFDISSEADVHEQNLTLSSVLDNILFVPNKIPGMYMDDHTALSHLEGLAYNLGIQIRYEKIVEEELTSAGGLCRLKGECVIIVNSRTSIKDKIQTLVTALKNFDLTDVYIVPALRELFERVQKD
jgi:hypothetical protein